MLSHCEPHALLTAATLPRVAFAASTASPTIHHHRVSPSNPPPPSPADAPSSPIAVAHGERSRRLTANWGENSPVSLARGGSRQEAAHRARSSPAYRPQEEELNGKPRVGEELAGKLCAGENQLADNTRGEELVGAIVLAPHGTAPAAWTAAAAATSYPAVAATCYLHFDSVAAASSLTPPQSLPTAVAASTMPPPPSPQPTLLPSLVVAATLSYHRSPHGLCFCWNVCVRERMNED